jgi:hypothetical protein
MEQNNRKVILERRAGRIKVKVVGNGDESILSLCKKLNDFSIELRWLDDISYAIESVNYVFKMSKLERNEIGLNNDYHLVLLSLLRNLNQCMTTSEIANGWAINSGRVSRVFTASRKSFKKYEGHFEKCANGGYHFTFKGLQHALNCGISEISKLRGTK